MIIEPNLTDLMKNKELDSRYTLVVAAAKRAREIATDDPSVEKAVKIAVKEIADGKVHIIHESDADDSTPASYEELADILGASAEE